MAAIRVGSRPKFSKDVKDSVFIVPQRSFNYLGLGFFVFVAANMASSAFGERSDLSTQEV
jgi:hypothetical protein